MNDRIMVLVAMGMSKKDATDKYNEEEKARKEYISMTFGAASKKTVPVKKFLDSDDDVFGSFLVDWLA